MRHLYTLLFALLGFAVQAQISFSNQTTLLNNPTNFHSGVAVAVADMNGDGRDDIVRLDNGSMLSIEYQTAPNQQFANYIHGDVPGDAWAMVVGDLNNDGLNDVLAGGSYDGVKILTNNGNSLVSTVLSQPGTFVQGSNFADINNDGWLDAFTCHDDGESRIWGNDGTGSLVLHDEWIDMATTPQSDNSGNYGSVWSDFDNDRDLDLYIAKCRQGVDNVNDPRRINALFVNDGQNNYTEQAGKYGLKIQWQSWTAEFQDIDNDGDMDCLVTNHDYNLQLLENDGAGYFTDISATAGVAVNGYFIQGIMRDFDNDGFVDIITVGNFNTSGVATHLFHNNGDKTFTEIVNPFGSPSIGTLATGDLNQDGFLDIYAAYQTSFNNPSNTADRLWMNDGNNGNNYIAFDLEGISSNRLGVGARIEIHGDWGIQIREVRAGESYGIQNSLTSYFGIGTSTEVEYAVIHWPSGKVDVVKNPAINQKNTVVEGVTCELPGFVLGTSGPVVLCPGELLSIAAPPGYDYLWSNGSVGQTIEVGDPGNYSVVIVDAQGCAVASEVLAVVVNPDETPTISLQGDDTFCQGSSAVLNSSDAFGYTWSTGEITPSIVVTQTGDYTVTTEGFCGFFTSQTFHIEVLPAPAPVTTSQIYIPSPGPVTLTATGENLFWYDAPSATVPLANGPTFVTPDVSTTATFYVEDVHTFGGGIFETGMPEHQGSNFYNGANFNGQTIFEVYEPIVLKQVTMGTDQAGVRLIELLTEAGEPLDSAWVDLPVGVTVADLNFEIQPGNYHLATNTANNVAVLGTNSPRLYRSNQGVNYPYTVQDVLSITNSDLGSGFYYYFYDWQVEAVPQVCVSERIPVTVTVGVNSTEEQAAFGRLSVQPNPTSGLFVLEMEAVQSGQTDLRITDLAGRIIFSEQFEAVANVAQQRKIDLTSLPAGMYFLKITSGQRSGFAKIVVE